MRVRTILLALPVSAGLIFGQAASPQTPRSTIDSDSADGKTITGILVASSCSAAMMPRTTARTTPRGSVDMNADRARDVNQGTGTDSQLERTRTMEETRGSAGRMDTQAGNNVGEMKDSGKWDKTCFIGAKTDAFAFQTPDGRLLRVDSSGNAKIKSKLDSGGRVTDKNKIFRVRVSGDVDGDTIRITSIMM